MITIHKDITPYSGDLVSIYDRHVLQFSSNQPNTHAKLIIQQIINNTPLGYYEYKIYPKPKISRYELNLGEIARKIIPYNKDDDFDYFKIDQWGNRFEYGRKLITKLRVYLRVYSNQSIVDSKTMQYNFIKAVNYDCLKYKNHSLPACPAIFDADPKYITIYKGYPMEVVVNYNNRSFGRVCVSNGTQITQGFAGLPRIVNKCGTYIKWLNQEGTYSYLLFEKNKIIDFSTKSLGSIFQYGLDDKIEIERGKKVSKFLSLQTNLPFDRIKEAEDILMATHIYLYTFERFTNPKANPKAWQRVRIADKKFRYADNTNSIITLTIQIKLPEILTHRF